VSTTNIPEPTRQLRDDRARRVPPAGRGWAFTGVGAAVAAIVGIQASLQIDAVYDEKYAGDAERITERLGDLVPQILVMHFGTIVSGLLLLVFAAGLRRRLKAQAPTGSLLPDVAAGGLLLTSVAALLGSGFTTEIVFGLDDKEFPVDPEFAAVVAHWVGTIPWLWVGAGVAGVAVAVAALRHSAAPRWIGWVAAVLGGITLLFGISPLQYMAGYIGPLMLLALGLGFAFGDRRARTGR
jgi:hypothetical protein